ncbi:MAG: hypothetical protein DRH37_08605 [Deltaproteobacteria bacterium]|nr:MAG: hypothetical protein B5M55_04015 [Desulfococcus sp. 4484_242]RLC28910.1 MAG: hypothetical protein DRH37_08605 [Deltaproteobacteria bacterium]
MHSESPIFSKISHDYLDRIRQLDLAAVSEKAGVEQTGGALIVPLFGRPYRVSATGILDPRGKAPAHAVKVVLCQYLLHYPAKPPRDGTWVSYKDFRDAAPLANTFHVHNEMEIAKTFSGRLTALEAGCRYCRGRNHIGDFNYDLQVIVQALPGIPMLLLFNDADSEFPAQCLLLFERRAERYLDMECLAILGWILTEELKSRVESPE